MTKATTVTGTATVVTDRILFSTKGDADMVNLTADVRRIVKDAGLAAGAVTVFFPGATGAVTTLAGVAGIAGLGNGTGGNALFNQPRGLVVDGNRNLWVVDTGNGAIRKVTPNGVVTTLTLTADTATTPPPSGGTTTPPPVTGSGSASGGGGGGAPSEWFCGALLLLAAVRFLEGRARVNGPATSEPV